MAGYSYMRGSFDLAKAGREGACLYACRDSGRLQLYEGSSDLAKAGREHACMPVEMVECW